MMMIYVVPINLRRFDASLYVKRFSQGNQCALSPAQQTSTILDLMHQEKITNTTEEKQDEIIDRIDINENPLIQNASKPSELRKPCKNAQVEVALL